MLISVLKIVETANFYILKRYFQNSCYPGLFILCFISFLASSKCIYLFLSKKRQVTLNIFGLDQLITYPAFGTFNILDPYDITWLL